MLTKQKYLIHSYILHYKLVWIIVSQASIHGKLLDSPLGSVGGLVAKRNSTELQTTCFYEIKLFANLLMHLSTRFAHFTQQLSTFPTCTESAAILDSPLNQILRGEGRWDSKNRTCFKFPSLATERRDYFGQTIALLGNMGLPMPSSLFVDAALPSW